MRGMTVRDFADFCSVQVSASGMSDLYYQWIEDAYSIVRDQDWPWNWTKTGGMTFKAETQTGATYTWVEGGTSLISSVPVTLTWMFTGRKVKIGEEWYRLVDVGFADANKLEVDRPILSSEATGVALIFHRDEQCYPTTKIRDVKLNGRKLRGVPEYFFQAHYHDLLREVDSGMRPYAYIPNDSAKLASPAFAPVVTNSAVALAGFPAGTYYYFYTRFDVESGLESLPGPVATYVAAADLKPRIRYGNPVTADAAEERSYGFRLYRSDVNPSRSRTPMFLLTQRGPAVPGAPFDDANKSVYGLKRKWEGPQATIELFPKPDVERCTVVVDHLDNWYFRPFDSDYLTLGDNNQVIELLQLHILGRVQLVGKSPQEHRAAIAAFRSQMAWLQTQARQSGNADAGRLGTHVYETPGPSRSDTGSWIDTLPWKD